MAARIPVYLFTGFLEGGKTHIIQESMEDKKFNSGEKTLILQCEEGVDELDVSRFYGQNVYLEQIENEADFNKENLTAIAKKRRIDRIIIEYNGMWMLNTLYGTDKAPIAKPEGYIRGEYEPETNGVTYTIWKYEDGSVMKPVKNDFQQFYGINENGDPKVLLVKDTALAEQIAGMESAKFLFDHQNVIVGIAE